MPGPCCVHCVPSTLESLGRHKQVGQPLASVEYVCSEGCDSAAGAQVETGEPGLQVEAGEAGFWRVAFCCFPKARVGVRGVREGFPGGGGRGADREVVRVGRGSTASAQGKVGECPYWSSV